MAGGADRQPLGNALKLNSESIWFNPAAASFQSTQFDFSVGVTGIDSKATYTTLPDYTGKTQSRHFTSDNKIATPLYAYFNYKPLDWMSVGLSFGTARTVLAGPKPIMRCEVADRRVSTCCRTWTGSCRISGPRAMRP